MNWDEAQNRVREIVSTGIVIWTADEAHAADHSFVIPADDGFVGNGEGWTFRVVRIEHKGKVRYQGNAFQEGSRGSFQLSGETAKFVFERAAHATQ